MQMMGRRQFITLLGAGAAAAALPRCGLDTQPHQATYELAVQRIAGIQHMPSPAGIHTGDQDLWVASSAAYHIQPGPQVLNGMFRLNPASGRTEETVDLGYAFVNGLAVLPNGDPVTCTDGGFFHRDVQYPFPAELTESGLTLFPGAALLTGNAVDGHTLWCSVSRFDGVRFTRREDPFVGGALVAYPVVADEIDVNAVRIIETGNNVTALAHKNSNVFVLNSGNYFASSRPSIDIVDAAGLQLLDTVPLPHGTTFQVSTHLALDGDRAAYVGTADESRLVARVDLATGRITQAQIAPRGFHTSVVLNGGRLFVTSFDHQRAPITVLDPETLATIEVIELDGVHAGYAAASGNGIIQLADGALFSIQQVEV